MNKIYKVVWSKVKHCYVVTSELAKRQKKGCGARSLRTATVSMGVAAALLCSGAVLPIFGESVAEAGQVYVDASGNIVAKSNKIISGDNLNWNGDAKAVTITQGSSESSLFAFGNISYTSSGAILNAIPGRDTLSFKVVEGQLIEVHDAPITVIR